MIDTQAIRRHLLEAAIHGNLTDNSDDVTTEDIPARIEAQYNALLFAKETKSIVCEPMIAENLFKIPETWIWVSLRQLCLFLSRGKSPKYSEVAKYPVFAQKCNQPTGLALDRALFLDETTLDKWPPFFHLQDGDILINSTGTGTMGRVGYYESEKLNPEYPFIVPDSHVTVARLGKGVVPKYIYYALRSPFLQKIMEKQFRGSTNQKEFYINSVAALPIPLPPSNVQERIAFVLDSAYTILHSIDTLQLKYADNLTALRSKLIDAAIQGQLAEQFLEDGVAEELYQQIQAEKHALIKTGKIKKEKPISEIAVDEIPFAIPAQWKWVRLSSLMLLMSTGPFGSMLHKSDYIENGIPVINPANIIDGSIVPSKKMQISAETQSRLAAYELLEGMIVMGRRGEMGRCAVVRPTEDGWLCGTGSFFMKPSSSLSSEYISLVISSPYAKSYLSGQSIGMTMDNLNQNILQNMPVPLPPFAEQKRIIVTLKNILKMLEE